VKGAATGGGSEGVEGGTEAAAAENLAVKADAAQPGASQLNPLATVVSPGGSQLNPLASVVSSAGDGREDPEAEDPAAESPDVNPGAAQPEA
jgi:hypothetical protein